MDNIQTFLENIAQVHGMKEAKEIDAMMENGLLQYRYGRMIVWAYRRKAMVLAKILSKIARLEIRIYKDPMNWAVKNEVLMWGKVIAKRNISPIDLVSSTGL